MSESDGQPTPLPLLSKYTILDRIGQGGMGSVFLAQRHGRDDVCIVKVINEELLDNATVAQRFWREANVAATLNHGKIAKLTDAGKENGRIYLAIEFIKGVELEELMRALMEQGRMLPPGVSLTLAQDVLHGLEYAHDFRDSNGQHLAIVHRDLSPRNVMVTFDGEAKIIDFGLVRAKLGEWETQAGMLMGTLRYMSPEQATATPVDGRSDLYTFATVLYETLSGRFFIPDGKQYDVLKAVVLQDPTPLYELNPAISEALSQVICKAMSKAADDRYPDAKSFRLALLQAAPELSQTPPRDIGQFVQSVFPAHKARADAAEKMAIPHDTANESEPAPELTRAGAAGLASMDAPVDVPQVAVVDPRRHEVTELVGPRLHEAAGEEVARQAALSLEMSMAPQVVMPAAPTWLQTKVGLLTTVVLAAGAASAVTALFMAQALKPEPATIPAPSAPKNPVQVARVQATEPEPQEAPAKRVRPKRAKTRVSTKDPLTAPVKQAPAKPKAPVSKEARAAALLKDTRLTARQRSGLEGCFEQAKFVNRSAPDFGPCFARAKKYLGTQP